MLQQRECSWLQHHPRPAREDAPGEQGKCKLFSLGIQLTIVHRAKGVYTPKGIYEVSSTVCAELRREEDHCPHCLCSPCVIVLPLDFLKGSCDPHPANDEKRHRLYRMFWRLLVSLGLWNDPEYILRKEIRTVRDERREILPECVTQV